MLCTLSNLRVLTQNPDISSAKTLQDNVSHVLFATVSVDQDPYKILVQHPI